MRRFISRHFKKRQTNELDDQNHPQQQDLDSNDQPAPNVSNDEEIPDQQSNDISLSENLDNTDNQNNQNTTIDSDTDNSNINQENESKKPRPSLKHAATLPIQTQTFYYTIQEGDTLQIISDKFKIKESIIKKANLIDADSALHEGDVIQLFIEPDDTQKYPPIDVYVYDAKTQTDVFPGKLTIKKHNLTFSKKGLFHHHHHIDLCGYLESSILPHPSQNLNENNDSILVINYLKIPTDKSTSVTEYFSGPKNDLEKLRFEIIKTADFHQEQVNYKPPDPNQINFSQDFADNAGIKKRRKSNFGRNKKKEEPKTETVATVQTMKIFLPQIQFFNGQMEIIKKTDVFLVRKKLPARFQNSNWTRLYTSLNDGFLLMTLFKKVVNKRPLLLFIKTYDDEVIGAFIPSGMSVSNSFYGTIETFVFRFKTEVPTHSLFITRLEDHNDQKGTENNEQADKENINKDGDQINSEKNSQNDSNTENNDQNDELNSETNDQNNNNSENDKQDNDQIHSENNQQEDGQIHSENNQQDDDQIHSENNQHDDDQIHSENNQQDDDQIHSENNQHDDDQIHSENNQHDDDQIHSENNQQDDDQIHSENNNADDHSVSETNDQKDDQINIETKNTEENSNEQNHQTVNPNKETENTNTNQNKPSQKERTVLEVFRWNKLQCLDNRNFVFTNNDSILFGGGNASAIYIDKKMYGYSDPCDTFCSPRLTKKKRFEVSVIEVWQIS